MYIEQYRLVLTHEMLKYGDEEFKATLEEPVICTYSCPEGVKVSQEIIIDKMLDVFRNHFKAMFTNK